MIEVSMAKTIAQHIPQFKLGVIYYNNIVVSPSPRMLRGRFQLLQEQIKFELEGKKIAELKEIQEWRQIIKTFGVDPSKYRHSAEALLRRISKGDFIPSVNSAVDATNLLSIQYKIPFGIYDVNQLEPPVKLNIGSEKDAYEALNGRMYRLKNKLFLADKKGSFGSPFVDSLRSSVTERTTEALQIIYLLPSVGANSAIKQLEAIANLFFSLHGGDYSLQLIED